MASLTTCPRCRGPVGPDDATCPRCALNLAGRMRPMEEAPGTVATTAPTVRGLPEDAETQALGTPHLPVVEAGRPTGVVGGYLSGALGDGVPQNTGTMSATGPLGRNGPPVRTGPLNNTGSLYTGPVVYTGPLTDQLAAQGALQLLPQEAIAYQLGALYLTNKRVILLAPTVVRSAFIRDIDAVGTLTQRASPWNLFFGALLALLTVASVWAYGARETVEPVLAFLYADPNIPLFLAAGLGALALYLLIRYFFWVKRSLFVSVKGRPLITVSITDWSSRRLADMDAFVNAFFQIKDFLSGDLMERQLTGELTERQVTGELSERRGQP